MESYLKDQWYQFEEQCRDEELKEKKLHKTNVPFNKLQLKLDKKTEINILILKEEKQKR